MKEQVDAPDLQVDDNIQFQKRQWRVQRLGWGGMALVCCAALAGLLGPGPCSAAAVGTEALRLEYSRFNQQKSSADLRFRFKSSAPVAQLWIDQSYLAALELKRIVPQPRSERAEAGRVVFEFDVGAGDVAATVTLQGEYNRAGVFKSRAGLVGGPELSFNAYVYP